MPSSRNPAPSPVKTGEQGHKSLSLFTGLAELFSTLSRLDAGFILLHDEGIGKLLRQAAEELGRMAGSWYSLSVEQRAEEEAKAASWRPSTKHEGGEIAPADAVPSLARLLEEKKPLQIGGHVYYPSGRWVLRFPRKGGGSNGGWGSAAVA